jgi:hypothetical protein
MRVHRCLRPKPTFHPPSTESIESMPNYSPKHEERARTSPAPAEQRKENLWLSLTFNIAVPAVVLMQGSRWFGLEPTPNLLLALVFPLGYGLHDFVTRRNVNFISVLGVISVLLTGGIGLLHLPKEWIAIKESAIPGVLALAILVSLKTRYPLIRKLLFNDSIVHVERIEEMLQARDNRAAFERLLTQCTVLLSASFLLSAVLNFGLAKILIQSDTGTDGFNAELGQMTLWSYPIIVVPSMLITMLAFWKLLSGVQRLTGLGLEQLLKTGQQHPNSETP